MPTFRPLEEHRFRQDPNLPCTEQDKMYPQRTRRGWVTLPDGNVRQETDSELRKRMKLGDMRVPGAILEDGSQHTVYVDD